MVISSNNTKDVILPERGKQQTDLTRFNYKNDYRDHLFTVFLPCAKDKPYYKSTTHTYIKSKILEYIPKIWRSLIHLCTISEVIGIIPEKIEDCLFYLFRDEFYYNHYPSYEEDDVDRTSEWLKDFIKHYGSKFNYGYCTSRIFREICINANLICFPSEFNEKSALFEFRKIENVKELTEAIIDAYKNTLISRFKIWKSKESHSFAVLKFANENNPFSYRIFRRKFNRLRNPFANIDTFCHESKSDKGVFLYHNKIDKKFYFPKFITKILTF